MPRRVQWLEKAWTALGEFPQRLRAEALEAAGKLMADPFPTASQTYVHVPGAHRLDTPNVTMIYRVVGDEIDIVYVRPNS